MKDNFDLKKFLKENKTIENSNPYLKEEKEISKKEEKSLKKVSKQLKKSVKAHGVQAKTIDKALKEESTDLKSKIREMIINELSEEMDPELDYEGTSEEEMYGDYIDDEESYYPHLEEMGEPEDEESPEMDEYEDSLSQQMDADEYETYADAFSSMPFEESLDEAKEDEDEIETDEPEDTEEVPEEEETEETEETETEEEPKTGGGLEDIAADMEGDEGDLMDHLISALKVSKAMDNEKLTTQIGNTLKFFVGEYIGGEE